MKVRYRRSADLDDLRSLGFTIARSATRMDAPFRVVADVVVLDATRDAETRRMAEGMALDVALMRLETVEA